MIVLKVDFREWVEQVGLRPAGRALGGMSHTQVYKLVRSDRDLMLVTRGDAPVELVETRILWRADESAAVS